MSSDPVESLRLVLDVARRTAAGGDAPAAGAADAPAGRPAAQPAELLVAIEELHSLRDLLTDLEPRLIAAARDHGVSWAALADVLGVASRQAAERRYLRLRPAELDAVVSPAAASGAAAGDTGTADQRVQAVRDRRAADRAVAVWARENSALLRRLAGRVSSLADLADAAQHSVDLVHTALGDDDSASLLGPLAGAAPHLAPTHPALVEQINRVTSATDDLRRQTHHRRARP